MEPKSVPEQIANAFSNSEFKTTLFSYADKVGDVSSFLKESFPVDKSPKDAVKGILVFLEKIKTEGGLSSKELSELENFKSTVKKGKFLVKLAPLPTRLCLLSIRFILEKAVEKGINTFQGVLGDENASRVSGIVYKIVMLNITTNASKWNTSLEKTTKLPGLVKWDSAFSSFVTREEFEGFNLYIQKFW